MGATLCKMPSMRPARRNSSRSGSSSGSGSGSGSSNSSNSHQVNGGGSSNGIQYTAELSDYEKACHLDPELQSFDSTLQQRTSHAISTLALGVGHRSLSFNTLKEVTDCFFQTNNEVVDVILKCKEDIWKNPQLFDLVKDYFDCSIQTLDYCTELEKCLKNARDSHLIIQFALQRFEEEDAENDEAKAGENSKKYTMTIEKLRQFKAAGNPFTEEFAKVLQSVYNQQKLMLAKLLLRKRKLDKKLLSIKSWRKLSNIIFVAALMGVIVSSVVAAAVAAPPVAAALAAAAAIPVGSMGKWIDTLLKKYEEAVGGEEELLSSMQFGTWIALKDLDTIRVMVDSLEGHFNSLLENTEFALREEDAVKFAIQEIKKKLEVFMKGIEDLGMGVDRCSRHIGKARTAVLRIIIKGPSK